MRHQVHSVVGTRDPELWRRGLGCVPAEQRNLWNSVLQVGSVTQDVPRLALFVHEGRNWIGLFLMLEPAASAPPKDATWLTPSPRLAYFPVKLIQR